MTNSAELRKQGFLPYRKTTVTYARQMSTGFAVRLLNGDVIYGKPGDYVCVSPENEERWVVDHDVFGKTYALSLNTEQFRRGSIQSRLLLEGFKPFRKHQVTWAKKLRIATVVKTLEGDVHAKAGDYLCVGAAGERWPQAAARFEANYVQVEEVS